MHNRLISNLSRRLSYRDKKEFVSRSFALPGKKSMFSHQFYFALFA